MYMLFGLTAERPRAAVTNPRTTIGHPTDWWPEGLSLSQAEAFMAWGTLPQVDEPWDYEPGQEPVFDEVLDEWDLVPIDLDW